MKLNFLFWNLYKRHLEEQVYNLAINFDIHVFLFAECQIPPEYMLGTLNRVEAKYHYSPPIGCDKIEIYTKFPSRYIQPVKETSRITVRRLDLPNLDEILLAVVHLPSKLHWSDVSQSIECSEISRVVTESEEAAKHRRTILIGDLNMNPFESGLVAASGLHGIMSRQIALKSYRVLNGRKHFFFYNPMWNLLGDNTHGPPGSFYYNSSEQVNYYWGLLDQVLLRPELIEHFDLRHLKILDSDGYSSLLDTNNVPDKQNYSDHLPILFSLEF